MPYLMDFDLLDTCSFWSSIDWKRSLQASQSTSVKLIAVLELVLFYTYHNFALYCDGVHIISVPQKRPLTIFKIGQRKYL